MPGIFISYRREDSQAWAGRLYDALRRAFGPSRVFRDIDTLEPGVDYAEAIERWLARCDVALVVIGPQWLMVADRNGRRRLDDPNDLTRLETATALRRGIRVVPVLVGGAAMPLGEELPEDLRGLARRQAHEVSDRRWDYDLEQLATLIRRLGRATPISPEESGQSPYRRLALLSSALLALLVLGVASRETAWPRLRAWLLPTSSPESSSGETSSAAPVAGAPPEIPSPARTSGTDPSRRVGDVFRDCTDCPEMVVIPAGEFTMGSPPDEAGRKDNEGPQHRVRIAQPFAVGRFEVTFDEWDACVAAKGCDAYRPNDNSWGRGRRPVINISWRDAQGYVRWLSAKTGRSYRLPSEAEWEYAARGGTTSLYWWGGASSAARANYAGAVGKTTEVGTYGPNPWGLYDSLGNVLEWVEDCYHPEYEGAPTDGGSWAVPCSGAPVVRGGAWNSDPQYSRSAFRDFWSIEYRSNTLGFRVVRVLNF